MIQYHDIVGKLFEECLGLNTTAHGQSSFNGEKPLTTKSIVYIWQKKWLQFGHWTVVKTTDKVKVMFDL